MNVIVDLQGSIENMSRFIRQARTALAPHLVTPDARQYLEKLECQHGQLISQCENLFAAVNVHTNYPTVLGAGVEFLRILFQARNLKTIIRKRAIGSFLERDRLDQAVAGRSIPLGEIKQIY